MKNYNNKHISEDYSDFEEFNEDIFIEEEDETKIDYTIFEEDHHDLIRENYENEMEIDHISAYYKDEAFTLESYIEDYEKSLIPDYFPEQDELDYLLDSYEEIEKEFFKIELYLAEYDEYKDFLDLNIGEYEENKSRIKSDIEYYEEKQLEINFGKDYHDWEDPFDEIYYYKYNEKSLEKEYDNFLSKPVNNNIDYGNLHEMDNFSDYLDYRDMDTVEFHENVESPMIEIEYEIPFEMEVDYDFSDEYESSYEDMDPVDLMIVSETEEIGNLIKYHLEIQKDMKEDLDNLIASHIYDDERYDDEIDSYIKSMEIENENLLSTINEHMESEYSEAEYADYEDFDDYRDLDFDGIDFDDLNNLDGTGNVYFNFKKQEDEYDSLNDDNYYGEYQNEDY